ncbi:hypothetical protein KBY97_11715 [Synechococcus sp. ATX 2A4]|uniref:hypothetical protein n=1 Tax=Synechococcus sp. ATX 2A4 TaxID=2823727 RepID=UPI0020CF7B9C|nr:hypothetical protein [Synechococcus sp. ATX 2A4]MCP9885783.1 hypothetical protein [Synechococcus sp. ATX 2A4]
MVLSPQPTEESTTHTSGEDHRGALKAFVAFTPLVGAVVLPLVVPVLMVRVGVSTGVGVAVAASCVWFVAMLRTAEMPGHH